MSLFAGLYFYACADYWHMACDRQNCGSIYSQQKRQHATTKKNPNQNQKSTYETMSGEEKYSRWLKGSTVLRSTGGIIPLSRPQRKLPLFLLLMQLQTTSASRRERQRPGERAGI